MDVVKDKFKYRGRQGQTGYITIRFLINCKGDTGRFRVTEMDFDLKPKKFDTKITQQILAITKELDGWKALERWENTWDVQQYLTFRFEDGILTDILP